MLFGSVADLDTVCCHTPSSKLLTNTAVVVSLMALVRGGRLNRAELWMHSGNGRRMWCMYATKTTKMLLLLVWICVFVATLARSRVCGHS